jgi:hypothetical protein
MSRYIMVKELDFEFPGAVLTEGSVRWDDLAVPLVHGPLDEVLGHVEDIRRDGNTITGEFVFMRERVSEDAEAAAMEVYGGAVYLGPVEKHMFKEICFITDGPLRYVFLTTDIPWAGQDPVEA